MNWKKMILILSVVLAFVIMPGYLSAQDDDVEAVKELIKNAPPASQFPNASAITLLRETTVTVQPDHKVISEEHLVMTLMNDLGKRRYGDQKRRYDKDSDTIQVLLARTFDKDLNIVNVEDKAINDITPASLMGASMYSNIMQKVVSFPALEPGVTIELKLIKRSSVPDPGDTTFVWANDLFQNEDPILSKSRKLIIPKDMKIKYTVQNEGLNLTVDTVGDNIEYTWKTTFAQQIIPEPDMPPMTRIAPRLIYTSADSWDQAGSWFANKFYKHTEAGDGIKSSVKELKKAAKDRDDLIEKISLFVIQNVREVNLALGLAGYEPHDAELVFDNKYGDWRDKTVLLVSMLREAGIEAYPVFINDNEAITAEDMPSLDQFTSLYVYIPGTDGNARWINPFADYCPYGYFPSGHGSTCLLVKDSSSELVKAIDPGYEDNAALSQANYKINDNGDIEGQVSVQLKGYFDYQARANLKDMKPFELKQYFQQSANNIGLGSEVKDYFVTKMDDLTQQAEVKEAFKSPEIGMVEGDMMIFELPALPFQFIETPYPSLEMRFYDMMLPSDMMISTDVDIVIPPGYKIAYIPDQFESSNEFADLSFHYDQSDNVVHYVSTMELKKRLIPTDDYMDFKDMFDQYSMRKNRIILLEKM